MSLFLQTLSKLNKGGACAELDDTLAKLTQQCRLTGKAGSLTLKIAIVPIDADGAMVEVHDKISVSMPDIPRHKALFYTTDEGRLTRNDPNQPELPMEIFDGGKTEEPNQEEKAS